MTNGRQGTYLEVRKLSAKLDDIINFKELDDDKRKGHSFPKLGALYGAGAITGAGIATGSAATRSMMTKSGSNIQKVLAQLDKYFSKKL